MTDQDAKTATFDQWLSAVPSLQQQTKALEKAPEKGTLPSLVQALLQAKQGIAMFDGWRKEMAGPYQEGKRSVDGYYGQVLEPLKALEGKIKSWLTTFYGSHEAQRRKLAEAGETPPPPLAFDGVQFVERQIAKVDDAAKVPRKFLVPDEKAIQEALQAGQDVPGARLATRYEVRASTRG